MDANAEQTYTLLEELLRAQADSWQSGEPLAIEQLIAKISSLPQNAASDQNEWLMALISHEVVLRERAGQTPILSEYQQRYPDLSNELAIQWQIDRLIDRPGEATLPISETFRAAREPESRRLPSQIGRYEIRTELGRGAIGVVYKAWDPLLKRPVALKRLRDGLDAEAEALKRIRAEAEAIARIHHSSIVQIYEIIEIDEQPYLAMEYCPGGTLSHRLAGSPLSPKLAAELMLAIAKAVAAVHQSRIIHRDLKPGNVLLESSDGWNPKVSDFGLAKLLDVDSGATATGNILGTPSYMAPEQAFGDAKRVAAAADIYSLGAILYECLTGSAPFRGATVADTLEQVRTREPVAVRQLAPKVPHDLETITLKCLRKSPADRYVTAQALVEDLENFLAGRSIVAQPLSRTTRVWRWCHRNPQVATLLMSVFALLCATVLILSDRNRHIRAGFNEKAVALSELTKALAEKEQALQSAASNELLARKRFYAAEINLAQHALEQGETARVLELLEHQRPRESVSDLRGFEWNYLYHQIQSRLHRTWTISKQEIHHLTFSPDGRWLAVCSGTDSRGQVAIWDVASGAQERTFLQADTFVNGAAFSPDSRYLLSGLANSGAGIWEVASGELIAELITESSVRVVDWSRNGGLLAAGCYQGQALLWDAQTRELIPGIKHESESIRTLRFSPDSQHLYVGVGMDYNQTRTSHYDLGHRPINEAQKIAGIQVHDVSSDGQRLLGVRWGDIYVRDRISEKTIWSDTVSTGSISSAQFSVDQRRVVRGGNNDRTAEIWNIDTGQVVSRVAHRYPVSSVAFDPLERYWASGSEDGVVNLWRDEAVPPLRSTTHSPPAWRMALSDQNELFTGGPFPAEARESRLDSPKSVPPIRYLHDVSADGQTLMAVRPTATPETTAVGEATTSGEDSTVQSLYYPDSPAPGPPETIEIWSRNDSQPRISFQLPDRQSRAWRAVTLSPNGKLLAARQWDGPVRVWDISGDGAKQLTTLEGKCLNLRFSYDAKWLAACCEGNRVRVWNLGTGDAFSDFVIEENAWKWTISAEFSRDGKYLAAGNGSGVVRVWELKSGRVVSTFSGHIGEIHALAFFPNGRTLAVAGAGPVSLWDFETGQELISLPVPDYKILQLAVSADGHSLFGFSDHGIVRRWDSE